MKLTDLKPHSNKLTLLHPTKGTPMQTKDGVDVVLNITGRDSQRFYDHQTNQVKKLAKDATDPTPEQFVNMVTEQLAVCITGWSKEVNSFFAGYDTPKGKGAYSHKLVVKLMSDGELAWLREQLDVFLDTRANFFKG